VPQLESMGVVVVPGVAAVAVVVAGGAAVWVAGQFVA